MEAEDTLSKPNSCIRIYNSVQDGAHLHSLQELRESARNTGIQMLKSDAERESLTETFHKRRKCFPRRHTFVKYYIHCQISSL